ncbi:hypothetical protein [uncultured Roseobacter sp.]|uniref:hypothetical protein n=1 Tax=uncultured Roseobacter sp. TaxID=114847 RepID=UPI0026031394|nr:hypothetical protein [uncultured Roseobacter sp.]
MSAPDTNIAKQKTRHRPALWGLWTGVLLAIVVGSILAWTLSADEAAASLAALELFV